MLIDTHCHYNLDPLWGNGASWQEHWQQAQAKGVQGSIVVGTDALTSKIAVDIAQTNSALYAAVGVHPTELSASSDDEQPNLPIVIQELDQLLTNSKVVAVGEIGFDYFRTPAQDLDAQREIQKDWCNQQLALAKKYRKVTIFHVRDKAEFAYLDTLTAIKEANLNNNFVLHCFSGPPTYIEEAIELGAYFGIAANITYPNAQNLRDYLKIIPQDKLLLETDAPFLPPQQHRGNVCQPWMVSLTAEYLKTQLSIEPEKLTANAQTCFGVSFK